jgi:hypothetical protein
MFQVTKMPSRSRPARGSRSFNHLNFHQEQLAILKFAEAPATSRIGAMIQHSSNSLCICDSMSNARKTGAQQPCKPLAILGLASPGNAHFPARHDETTQNCRYPGIFTRSSKAGNPPPPTAIIALHGQFRMSRFA